MTNLFLVTFELDLTQFLVSADGYNWEHVKEVAINRAIIAHVEYGYGEFGGFDENELSLREVNDKSNYSVDPVSMETLLEIIKRKDWLPRLYCGAVIFS